MKDTVYGKKPKYFQHLKQEVTNAFNDIPLDNVNLVCQSVLARCVRYIAISGNHFEHL